MKKKIKGIGVFNMYGTEYWDVLNKDGSPTGERVKRSSFTRLPSGKYHLVVHIWLTNSKKEILLQRRSENRPFMSGEWAATGGSAIAGEDSKTAAIRELNEELGIKVMPNEIKYMARKIRKNSIVDIYKVGIDVDISALQLQKEEVMDVKWATREQFEDMIKSGEFHNYGSSYFKTIFEII